MPARPPNDAPEARRSPPPRRTGGHGRAARGAGLCLSSLAAALALGLVPACAGAPGHSPPVDASAPTDAPGELPADNADCVPEVPLPLAFAALGRFPVDDRGQTADIAVPYPADLRYLAIRITADPPSPSLGACYRLEPVGVDSGAEWVAPPDEQDPQNPVCTACTERVYTGHGYALFVFPNNGQALGGPDTLRFRVQLRHCAYGVAATRAALPDLPTGVSVDVASEAEPTPSAAEGTATLRVRLAAAPGAAVPDATLEAAWTLVARLYAAAGIALQLEGVATLPGTPLDALRYGPGADRALDETAAAALDAFGVDPAAGDRALTVVFVPCLERRDPVTGALSYPAGLSPRIPAGAPVDGFADAVFVATADCPLFGGGSMPHSWADAAELGLIIAHELGHALGLHHADTFASRHRAPAGPANVMITGALSLDPQAAAFSAAQAEVLRRHPAVWPGPLAACP